MEGLSRCSFFGNRDNVNIFGTMKVEFLYLRIGNLLTILRLIFKFPMGYWLENDLSYYVKLLDTIMLSQFYRLKPR